MSKTYLIRFSKDYSVRVNTELQYLTDPSPARFIEGEKDGRKYFINRDNILYFYEYDKEKDSPKVKQH